MPDTESAMTKIIFSIVVLVLSTVSASAAYNVVGGKFRLAQSQCGPACTGGDIAICTAYKIKDPTGCCPQGCTVQ